MNKTHDSKTPKKSSSHGLKRVYSIIVNFLLLLFSLTCVFPLVWLLYTSFNDMKHFSINPIALPPAPSLQNYAFIFNEGSKLLLWMWNTVRNTAISLVLILLLGFVFGYFFSRIKFRGKRVLRLLFMAGIVIPMHALMIPIYVLFSQTELADKWYTLILPYVSFGLPLAIFLIESYIYNIPREIEEAAVIDGCSFTQMLFRIILPMTVPILASVAIIQFFSCWNEFAFALILINDSNLTTIQVGMTFFKGSYTTDFPRMMAFMLVSLLPALGLYLGFSKQIIKGMVMGAVKG